MSRQVTARRRRRDVPIAPAIRKPSRRRKRDTDIDELVFEIVATFVIDRRYAPTRRDIAEVVDESIWVVMRSLKRLQAEGWVDWIPNAARTVHITP